MMMMMTSYYYLFHLDLFIYLFSITTVIVFFIDLFNDNTYK